MLDDEDSPHLTNLNRLFGRLQGGGRDSVEAAPRALRKQARGQDAEWGEASHPGLRDADGDAELRDVPLPAALTAINYGIRTGLTNLLSFVASQDGSSASAADRAVLQAAAHSGEAVLSWLDIMGLYTNLDQGDVEPTRTSTKLISRLSGASAFAQVTAKERGVDLIFAPHESLAAPSWLDAEWLDRCALNLFESVVRLHDAGRVVIRVEPESSDSVLITVDGSGAGIDAASSDLARRVLSGDVWFATADGSLTLRLAVARRAAITLGGDLTARMTGEGGLVFEWRLPTPPAEDVGGADRLAISDDDILRSILVVEDNTTNLRLVERMLRRVGHHIEVARDGAEAVAAMDDLDVDIILMDLHMPNMDGFAAASAIRARGDHKARTPIVALTADVNSDVEQAALKAGMNGFLAKPFEIDELLDMIRQFAVDPVEA